MEDNLADLLTRHLEEKGKEHSALEMLVNQWGFDRQLIPKALQTIGALFPHYSRHDESHSKQILINIERLLGVNIKLLTATDTWLLLEAAYWHDIGMVVPQADLEEALKDEDFLQYIDTIRNSPRHELHEFCINFDMTDTSRCFSGASSPVEAVDKFRQLMAEWFRKRHPSRANTIIQSPWASIGITSPRTELIPSRLFRVLGRICQMHGASFNDILKEDGLPFREAGLAQEDCHPRFVACLLRMGDLLDLDDNRFCPVMQRIAGDSRPHISKAHEDKHSSIRHLRIDREYIEIDAECDSIDGYVEAFKWFDWLKQELQDQMANWQRIVPSRELGLLPTLGHISVRLRGELQILSEGDRPQFTIDADRAKELLQGSNLYSDSYACVRELLQNAVDATLLRLWVASGAKIEDADWQTPFSGGSQAAISSSFVKVELREKLADPLAAKSEWELVITDEGTGISRNDLIHMLKIGGSQGNIARQKRISSMPEWMKPSGVFGIGFQSAFLMSEKIIIRTKSIFTGESLNIVMHSPTQDKEGLVLLKRIDTDVSQPYGTQIVLNFSLENEEHPYGGREDEDAIAQRIAFSFDPVLDGRVSMGAARLADKIYEFAQNSPIDIRGEMHAADEKHRFPIERQTVDADFLGNWRFVKIGEHQVRVRYQPVLSTSRVSDEATFYYRGQKFAAHMHIPCGRIEVDIMSGKAGKWLNASRDALAAKAEQPFRDLVLSSLSALVSEDLKNTKGCEWMTKAKRPIFSYFLRAMARVYKDGTWEAFAEKLGDTWCDIISPDGVNSLRYYLNIDEVVVCVGSYEYGLNSNSKVKSYDIKLDHTLADLFLREWLKDPKKTISALGEEDIKFSSGRYEKFYSLRSVAQPSYTEAALAMNLMHLADSTYSNSRYVLRMYDSKWSDLFLREDIKVPAWEVFPYAQAGGGRVLLPFLYRCRSFGENALIDVPSLNDFCNWVKPHLISSATLDEIKDLYSQLISFIDNDVMKKSSMSKKWSHCRRFSDKETRASRRSS